MNEEKELRRFSDVFPNLKLKGDLADLLGMARVREVACSKKNELLRITLESEILMEKKDIYKLEKEIKRQLFPGTGLNVLVRERFHLSELFTPENWYHAYRDSILFELERTDPLMKACLATARVSFPDEKHMVVAVRNLRTLTSQMDELQLFLDRIANDRCGLGLEVQLVEQKRKSTDSKNAEAYHEGGSPDRRGEYPGYTEEGERTKDAVSPDEGGAPAADSRPGGRKKGKYGGKEEKRDRPKDPNLLYGRDFNEDSIPIESIEGAIGDVVVYGEILACEGRTLRSGRGLFTFAVTDDTDTIQVKIFCKGEEVEELSGVLKKGSFVRVKGKVGIDSFEKEMMVSSVWGIRKASSFRHGREDRHPEKRIELHCHTKMSDMDGVTDAADLVKRAYQWGHPAIAITDHGVVQSFPEANHAMEDIDKSFRAAYQKEHPDATKEELKKVSAPFKVIYGVEAYLVDDLKGIVTGEKGQTLEDSFVVFDLETTGFSPVQCKIIEIGAVRVEKGVVTGRFSEFVNPGVPIPFKIQQLTGINDQMVLEAEPISRVLPRFMEFCRGAAMVAHNAAFDISFIEKNCDDLQLPYAFTVLDTVPMAQFLLPGLNRFKLDTVAKAVGVPLKNHHRAVDDAACTADIFLKFCGMLREREICTLKELNEKGSVSRNTIRKLPYYHAIILATGETGRVNLYRMVSESHLNYFNRRPKLPKSYFLAHREGLIIGSACEAGELYQALLRSAPEHEIARIVDFYDYLEIQPVGNNAFMIEDENREAIRSVEDIQEMNRKVVRLGEQFEKPVVATCDVHFMDPKDEIYRRIIMAGKGFDDADRQAPLYLHTTEEMLEEFAYLGREKAEEIVIRNPRMIADRIEKISPIRAGKFPPVIENSDRDLREICYTRAHEIYGEVLPEVVEKRLERELNSIISNGYAVMYIIAQKLVWKSNEDGYLVGSRGSVGSSFAATMAGITEVNPLSPHYLCEACHYVDFDSDAVKAYAGRAGCDMPDADCPKCGRPLKKLGFDIPFETFLGFKGNKEPDIDLNFSGEYQSNAHKYTEVIFGTGQTFRAGTIGTLAEKTAFGYVKNYYAEHGIHKRNCEVDRIVRGCTGIRRTTGQHPGGIIVLPKGEDINSFTPVQHPANDNNTDIITTHFDYHSIDENLLKLDILGHDDPTMIRMLENLTGTNATEVPLDEPKVMSLFMSTEALGITPEQIGGCPLGCLGIPEFGTDFVIQMLQDTKPQSFSDLIRISGLSHGTDVWLGNAQKLIEEGHATISTAICTRDDIMTYLILKGMDNEKSFKIMESVRKGKGLTPEWEEDMTAHGVPDWYIWSCKTIKYMFPKAHAAAYVMMAYRIAWYKVYYPLAYYAAYFSIRASAFSYELMCLGQERLLYHMEDYRKRWDTLSKKEQETFKDMKIVREMYARGFDFLPVELGKAEAHRFTIWGDRLMPALDTRECLGDKAADAVVTAAAEGPFLSREDFRNRTKVSKTVIDLMQDLGIFGDIPETDQISLFDVFS